MASNPLPRKYTFDEYIAIEEETGIKHEFVDGEIFAMTGGTKRHAIIPTNCTRIIGNQFDDAYRDGCYVTNSELCVKISEQKYVYPDFIVVCGDDEFDNEKETTLLNPTLVCEVISESSEAYDTGLKSEWYRGLP